MTNLISLPKSGLFGFGEFMVDKVFQCSYCSNNATKYVWSKDTDGAFSDIESFTCDNHDEHFAKLNARA